MLRDDINISNKSEIIEALGALLRTLSAVKAEVGYLPENIAEYVFFPLSHLFRRARSLPSEALELSLRCLQVLLAGSWCRDVQSEAHLQLLQFLTYLINNPRSSDSIPCPDEAVVLAALRCLRHLLTPDASSPRSNPITTSQSRELILAHVTSILIDCVSHSSNDISTAASETLKNVFLAVQEKEILRKFTPGIMSTTTRYLQPSTWSRRSSQSFVAALSMLETLLSIILVPDDQRKADQNSTQNGYDWLKGCLPQMQYALLSVLRIKTLKRNAVTDGLYTFCYLLLSLPHNSFENLTATILETLLELSCMDKEENHQQRTSSSAKLMTLQPQLIPIFKDMLHRWLMTMSSLVLSHDTAVFQEHMGKIAMAYEVAEAAEIDLSILDTDLIVQVLNSATAVLDTDIATFTPLLLTDTTRATDTERTPIQSQDLSTFIDLPLHKSRHSESLEELGRFVKALLYRRSLSSLESYLAKSTGIADERLRLAHLWIFSRIMHASLQQGLRPSHHLAEHLSFYTNTYNTSLEVLATSSLEPPPDWRIHALALEIVAIYALIQGSMFRPELLGGLYPVVESLATSNLQLRESAWLCIRIVSRACGYDSPNELILQNVDYLINSVALKMNISAISLEAPKALVMMIRICRDAIVPYLDDIIDSTFSTLAAYHGYPQLVEALFDFLSIVISVSAESKTLKAESRVQRTMGDSITELVKVLQIEPHFDHGINTARAAMAIPEDKNSPEDCSIAQMDAITVGTRTNSTTVLSIVTVSQHYLTHDSTNLRCQILKLVGRSCGVLYTDESRFLPLIHEIWPVVVRRLYDSEASVCIAACSAIADIVRYAGQFMQMRIEDEWSDLSHLYLQKSKNLEQEKSGSRGRGQAFYTWEALTAMLCSLIGNIQISANIEDEIVEMLLPYYDSRDDVRYTLDSLNEDAIWLRKWLSDAPKDLKSQPQVVGYMFQSSIA